MDFTSYLNTLVVEYEQEGLEKYYVPAEAQESNNERYNLRDFLKTWLATETTCPIALLGGYGTGKTTFARHIAHESAKQYLATHSARIPLLIPLGELCSQQTVDGLFGRLFASIHPVKGYSFGLFQQPNQAGSFVIILDGFDEMKHAMTTEVFRYTFKERLKLVAPNSKVILSGRPTAFLSEAERREFLQALEFRNGKAIPIKGRPTFREITLSPFGASQIRLFSERYRTYLKTEKHCQESDMPSEQDFTKSESISVLNSIRFADRER